MKIEVLISTMNLKNQQDLLKKMNVDGSVIINQTKNKSLTDIETGKNKLFSYEEKGLSKSRNKAIEHSSADICIIADDDLRYEDDYEKIVEEGYKKYPDADVIAFYVDNVDDSKRRKARREGKINLLTSMRVQSVQMTFKRESITKNVIKFNENFGAGTEIHSGEENIFLKDCLKKKLRIYNFPKKIATIQNNDSTWMKGHDKQYFIAKGATFYEIFKFLYPLIILQFAVRKKKKYSKEISVLKAIKYMFKGVKQYKDEK